MRNIHFFKINDKTLNKKKIYLFGNGDIATKTYNKIRYKYNVHGIFDYKKTLHDSVTKDKLKIINPNTIKKLKKNIHIIITTSSYNDVSKQLKNIGLVIGENYTVTPLLKDQSTIDEIQNYEAEMYFTSGTFKKNNKKAGGGIYYLKLNKNNWYIKKILSGPCYSLINYNKGYAYTSSEKGLVTCDRNFKTKKIFLIDPLFRAHGISFSKKFDCFFIACANLDKVLMIEKNLKKIVYKFKISQLTNNDEISKYHCNDCFVHNNSLYVSVFSISGNYKHDSYDGGIIEFDIPSGKKIGVIKSNLTMPHNISLINDKFHILDSLNGNLLTNNFTVQGTFPGFSRGLDFNGKYYFIGQSRNRQFSKQRNIMNNVSSDTGVIIFDNDNKVSRFLNVNNEISEIHSILVK